MSKTLFKNIQVVSSEKTFTADVLIEDGLFSKIATEISGVGGNVTEINGEGLHLFPGVIDDQVHFREPGLTHKANIYTEARAAVAGGITSFMEMPNTNPQTITQERLEEKYEIARNKSLANYSFFMGVTNSNLDEVLKTNLNEVCGAKVFMGSSTGNMLVDDTDTLEKLFREFPGLIATHCEDEGTITANFERYKAEYGDDIPFELHPVIRDAEACYISSSKAVGLARKNNARLHILHISTAKELELFEAGDVANKNITAEACIHHLWFTDKDYAEKGALIKWNPAVKSEADRNAIRAAVNNNVIDVLATDHAPHTLEEKNNLYTSAPSGGPLVQHSLVAGLELVKQGVFTKEMLVKKMSEDVTKLFRIENRGYIKEGYKADCVVVNLNNPWEVSKSNIYCKCGWSPFEGTSFSAQVESTFVNGNKVFHKGSFNEEIKGERLTFKHNA